MPRRVLVLGLDSASLPWVERWAEEGRLPHLARLMARGARGVLRSVNPPLSPAAWSSFATGMVPAKHGVFDHIYRRPGTYDVAPTGAPTRAGRPVWQILSDGGSRVGVVNVPETYPPSPLNGFMLSGMDTPSDDSDFAFPPELKGELERAVGGYKVFGVRSKENLDRSIAGMHQTIPMRARAGRYLWEAYRPAFMILVFMETDVIQHKCWKYMDPGHPEYETEAARAGRAVYAEAIPDIYARIDKALGPWLESLEDDTTVIVMSDHGAGPLYKFLYINNWLASEGLLHFRRSALTRLKHIAFRLGLTPANAMKIASRLGMGLFDRATDKVKADMTRSGRTTPLQRVFLSWSDVEWERTRAYTLGGNLTGIYVNLSGREPRGSVAPGAEYEALRKELAERLAAWRDPESGLPIVDRVYMREEIHDGPFSERAPDVFFTTRDEAYVGSGGHEFASNRLMDRSPLFNGHHRMDGMILLSGQDVIPRRLEPADIMDVAPTVLHLLGHPIPASMDGRLLAQAFRPEFLSERSVARETVDPQSPPSEPAYSKEDEAEIITRLTDLGYM